MCMRNITPNDWPLCIVLCVWRRVGREKCVGCLERAQCTAQVSPCRYQLTRLSPLFLSSPPFCSLVPFDLVPTTFTAFPLFFFWQDTCRPTPSYPRQSPNARKRKSPSLARSISKWAAESVIGNTFLIVRRPGPRLAINRTCSVIMPSRVLKSSSNLAAKAHFEPLRGLSLRRFHRLGAAFVD